MSVPVPVPHRNNTAGRAARADRPSARRRIYVPTRRFGSGAGAGAGAGVKRSEI